MLQMESSLRTQVQNTLQQHATQSSLPSKYLDSVTSGELHKEFQDGSRRSCFQILCRRVDVTEV